MIVVGRLTLPLECAGARTRLVTNPDSATERNHNVVAVAVAGWIVPGPLTEFFWGEFPCSQERGVGYHRAHELPARVLGGRARPGGVGQLAQGLERVDPVFVCA